MTEFSKDQTPNGGASDPEDLALAAFFDAARPVEDLALAPPALLARVLDDALHVQQGFATQLRQPAPPARGWLAGLLAAVGGWPALSGLATAGMAGVWLGFSPPTSVGDLAAEYLGLAGSYDLELVPAFAEYGVEEGAIDG